MSLAFSQTAILAKNVFLVESVDAKHDRMVHLKAVVFVRPTKSSLRKLKDELEDPKYGEYHIFFSNIVPEDTLRYLAEHDPKEVVREVQEFFGDFYTVNPDTFHCNVLNSVALSAPRSSWGRDQKNAFKRSLQGLIAALLSLKVRPTIRYAAGSDVALKFAHAVKDAMAAEKQMFGFNARQNSRMGAPLLLIMDRRDDPVTPLLTQWTYQAMIHELLGIEYNVVNMPASTRKENQRIVLNLDGDNFLRENMYSNFGDVGMAIKRYVEAYKVKSNDQSKVDSIADMQRFLENYPEFKRMGLNVSKHVQLFSELSRLVDVHSLMGLSALEQDLVCSDGGKHEAHLQEVRAKVKDPSVNNMDALRLALLYGLRYEATPGSKIGEMKRLLHERGVSK